MAHVKLKTRKRIVNKSKGIKKIKFRSSAIGRVRITGTGKFRITKACKAHGMIKHSSRQKDMQVGTETAKPVVAKVIKRFWRFNKKTIKS